MVTIQKTDAINIIRDQAGLSLKEGFPQNLAMIVQPVMDMTPDFHPKIIPFSNSRTTTGTSPILTGEAKKKYKIYGLLFQLTKDATCDMATSTLTITVTIDGIARTIAGVSVLTLTAQNISGYMSFSRPIETDIAASVSFPGTFTVGSCVRSATVYASEEIIQ